MTNREYLNTLPNDEYASVVVEKLKQIEFENYESGIDVFDSTMCLNIDFEEWLNDEREEE